ncbi:MAG: hypothetical protein ACYC1L_02710 [Alphaproteobacteria bacterium]
MSKRIFGAAVFVAATVLSAGSALAAYQTTSSAVASPAVIAAVSSSTASVTAGGISSAIGGGFGGSFVGLPGKSSVASRQGGGFAGANNGQTGASAGSEQQRFGVWGNFGGSGFNEDQSAIASSGQIYTFMAGGDYRFNDWVIAGLSAGYERQDITT